MRDDQPSHTALQVAAARAAHRRFDPPPHLLDDRLAEPLLGEAHAPMVDLYHDDAHWVLRENRLFLPLRARWAEDRVVDAYARGVRHYLILGAGLDSFAWRRPAGLEELRIVEVDHPATQRWKRARLDALAWPVPPNLTFVECDFARAALAEVRALLGAGSELLLDYLHPYEDLSPRYLELAETSGSYLRRVGEPQVNKLRPKELESDLLGAGFAQAILVDRTALRARYLADLATDVPLSERLDLAVARV